VEIDAGEDSPGIPPLRQCERNRRERAASPDVVEVCADDGDAGGGGEDRASAADTGLFFWCGSELRG
jgi:hypothetical protein